MPHQAIITTEQQQPQPPKPLSPCRNVNYAQSDDPFWCEELFKETAEQNEIIQLVCCLSRFALKLTMFIIILD